MERITLGNKNEAKRISPELHSQFIEFLGNCISDGIWVGKESSIPNYNGLRKDVIDALKNLQPPVVRWPGCCYADMYHWRDGVGKERKVTWNENFGTYEQEKNEFGTHEFMNFCQMIGAKPWLNINMLRGSVEETVEWAEYCNRKEDTSLSKERAENGSPEPFNVEYWGLGNECWAGGGNYTAQGYADEYRKYASAIPSFKPLSLDGSSEGINMKFIACGPDGNKPIERVKWTKDFFKALSDYRRPQIDAFDLHFYNWNLKDWQQPETEFNTDEWYQVLYGAMELETVIQEQSQLIAEGASGFPKAEGDFPEPPAECRLIVGEWGNWHGKAFFNRPALYQQCTMRDALTTAITLDIFHRNSDLVSMACVAQTVNVLNSLILTEGEKFVLTPNYYVFDMYKPHRGGYALDIQASGEMACQNSDAEVPNIYSFASQKENVITLNVINANLTDAQTIEVTIPEECTCLSGKLLHADNATDHNTFENPNLIVPTNANIPESNDGKTWLMIVPPASVNVFQFKQNKLPKR